MIVTPALAKENTVPGKSTEDSGEIPNIVQKQDGTVEEGMGESAGEKDSEIDETESQIAEAVTVTAQAQMARAVGTEARQVETEIQPVQEKKPGNCSGQAFL